MKFNFVELEQYRVRVGVLASKTNDTCGAFLIPYQSYELKVIATDGTGFDPKWEHVSVSLKNRCPNWLEMSYIKSLFWDKEETVVQFHPPESKYVNNHPNCLHLWKLAGEEIELPPTIYVGLGKEG